MLKGDVEHHGRDRSRGEAVAEHHLHIERKLAVDAGNQNWQQPHGQTARKREQVAVLAQLDLAQHIDAHRRDDAEHDHRGAADHRPRDRIDQPPQRRKQGEYDQDDAAGRRDEARAHAGRPDHADVLAAGDDQGGAETSAQQGNQRIAADRLRHFGTNIDVLAHRLRDRNRLAGGLRHRNHAEHQQRDRGNEIEFRHSERKRRRHAEHRARQNRIERHDANCRSHDRAGQQPEPVSYTHLDVYKRQV